MGRRWTGLTLVGLTVLGTVALTVVAQEKAGKKAEDEQKVALAQAPAPVRDALTKLAGTAKITEVVKESEDGVDVYEGKWTVSGLDHKATVATDGSLLETEDSVAAKDLPPAVQKAVEKPLAGAEKLSYVKKTIIVFEAKGQVEGKQREIIISPAGRLIGHDGKHEGEHKGGKDEEHEKGDD